MGQEKREIIGGMARALALVYAPLICLYPMKFKKFKPLKNFIEI